MASAATASACALAAVVVLGCGDGGDTSDRGPAAVEAPNAASRPLPGSAVARVGDRPIARRELARRVEELRRRPSSRRSRAALRRNVLTRLVLREALEEELFRRGHAVSPAQVADRLAKLRRRGWSAGAQRDEARLESRLRLLREAVHELIRRAKPRQADAAVARFERRFAFKWRRATVCRAPYAIPACRQPQPSSNGGSVTLYR